MERCLLDLLQREKDYATRINRSEDRIAVLKAEIEHTKEACCPSEWRDRDIAATQRWIAQEEDEIAWARSSLSDARNEMRVYFEEVFK